MGDCGDLDPCSLICNFSIRELFDPIASSRLFRVVQQNYCLEQRIRASNAVWTVGFDF